MGGLLLFGETGADVESELFLFRLFTFLVIVIVIMVPNLAVSLPGSSHFLVGNSKGWLRLQHEAD